MEIRGYKAFNKDHTNRYGRTFEEGKYYHKDGHISFGNHGNGFHMCAHLSDVFRFFDPDDIDVASVIGYGEMAEGEYDDWDEPYYDMYAVSDIYIEKFLTREEIIDIMSKSSCSDMVKFFATYNPTEEEGIKILRGGRERYDYFRAAKAFLYYIRHLNVYGLRYDEQEEVVKKVLGNGQDNSKGSKGK